MTLLRQWIKLDFDLLSNYLMQKDGELSTCGNGRGNTAAAVKASWMEKRSSCGSGGDDTAAAMYQTCFSTCF